MMFTRSLKRGLLNGQNYYCTKLWRLKITKKQRRFYQDVLAKDPSSENSKAYAFFLVKTNKKQEAQKLFEEALVKWPDKGWAALGLATLAMSEQDY